MTLTLPEGSAPRALFAALGAKLPPPPQPASPPVKPAAAEPSPEQAELAERLLQRYALEATPGAIATLAPHLTLGAWSREEELRREVLAKMVAQGGGPDRRWYRDEAPGGTRPAGAQRGAASRGDRVGQDPVMGGLARMAAEEAVTRTGQGLPGGKWPSSWA
jgi:hypothetical protein